MPMPTNSSGGRRKEPPLQAGEVLALYGRPERHTHFGSVPVTVLSHCRQGAGLSELLAGIEASARQPAT